MFRSGFFPVVFLDYFSWRVCVLHSLSREWLFIFESESIDLDPENPRVEKSKLG